MMRRAAFWGRVAMGVGLLLCFFIGPLARAVDNPGDPRIQDVKEKGVKKGDKGVNPETPKIDWETDAQLEKKSASLVENVAGAGGKIKITSLDLRPPAENWAFNKLLDANDFVEVVVGPEQTFGILTQNAQHIQFWGTAPGDTADFWPVKAEGNLAPPPGGQGEQPHWSAKIGRINIYAAFDPAAISQGDKASFIGYLNTNNWTKIDDKTYTKGNYAVRIVETQAEMVNALSADDESYVAYDGHSNFGMGFNFNNGPNTRIADFMQCAEECVAINWIYMRLVQGHPNFTIDKATEYGDDPTTNDGGQRNYDPVYKSFTVTGKYPPKTYTRRANQIAGGEGHDVFEDPDGVANENDHHITPIDSHAAVTGVIAGNNTGNGTLGGIALDDRYTASGTYNVQCREASTPPGGEEWDVPPSVFWTL